MSISKKSLDVIGKELKKDLAFTERNIANLLDEETAHPQRIQNIVQHRKLLQNALEEVNAEIISITSARTAKAG